MDKSKEHFQLYGVKSEAISKRIRAEIKGKLSLKS